MLSSNSRNRTTCGTCGSGGRLLKCFYCPRSFHSKCLPMDKSTKLKHTGNWVCVICSENQSKEQPLTKNEDRFWYKYLRMFDAVSLELNDFDYGNVPPIGMLLLGIEWIVSHEQLPSLAIFVSTYFARNRSFVGTNIEDMTNLFTQSPMDPEEFTEVLDQLGSIVDEVLLYELIEKLNNHKDASAIGLASSSQLFFNACSSCGVCRYLRSFCFNCGHVFDVSRELENSLAHIIEGSDPLIRLAADMQLEARMVGSSSLLEKSIRGSDTNSTTIDAILWERNGSSSASSSSKRVKSVPVIAPLAKKRSRDYQQWDEDARMHSDNKAKRNAEYYDVAFRAITQLQSLGRQGRGGFDDYGGDMLFLVRNLATNCTGLHRDYARRVFAEMCERWVHDNPGVSALQGGEHDVHCTVEVLTVLKQLVDCKSRSCMMYSEPESADTDERLSRMVRLTTRADDVSSVPSSQSDASKNKSVKREPVIASSAPETSFSSSSSVPHGGRPVDRKDVVDLTNEEETIFPARITAARIQIKSRSLSTHQTEKSKPEDVSLDSLDSEDFQVGCESKNIVPVASACESNNGSGTTTPSTLGSVIENKKRSSVTVMPRTLCTRLAKVRDEERLSHNLLVDVQTGAAAQHPELFNYRMLAEGYVGALSRTSQCNSLMELLCFDPKSEQVPFTPVSHCGNCGHTHKHSTPYANKNRKANNAARNTLSGRQKESPRNEVRKNCDACGVEAVSCIDYSALTDALCWAYLFECVGLDVDLHAEKADSLAKIVRLLPTARNYNVLNELGEDFYKWQCYFITHLVYAFSDYGQHALRRQLFAEEFEFMATQLVVLVVVLKDPEIVGEFVHCLKILQYTEESDPHLAVIVRFAMDFLVQCERELGCVGLFVARTGDFKDRYHASYCGAVGLLDSPFSENVVDRLSPPMPRLLSFI